MADAVQSMQLIIKWNVYVFPGLQILMPLDSHPPKHSSLPINLFMEQLISKMFSLKDSLNEILLVNWPQTLILTLNRILLVWYIIHNNKNRYDQQFSTWLAALVIGNHIFLDNIFKDMFSKWIILVILSLKSYWWPTWHKYLLIYIYIYYCIKISYINTSQNEISLTFFLKIQL